nr:hypothetical protein [Tanacetum cinerariifolium]
MPTKIELTLEQSQQVKMKILLEPTSNKLLVGSDNGVKSCSKTCEESYARLKKLNDEQRDKFGDASVEITAYTLALKRALKDKEIVDSGCSRHMTGNKAHLADYQEFKGGSVAFEGSNGRITSKGKIKAGKEYSNARTPQQNRVAERKNRTLIETARTKLAYSFLPTTFWAEAVNTACYFLNRVLVTKPQNKTPYELLTGKFNGKSNLGFLVGYSLNRKGHAWMFDLDYLTNSMNYEHVLVENQANKSVEHIVLPIWSAYSTTVKSSGDKIKKNTNFKTCVKPVSQVEQIFLEELEKLKRQEKEANDAARKETTHENQDVNTNSTKLLNAISTPISTIGHSRALYNGEPSYPYDPSMPHLEDIYASPSEGIFTDSSYDDEGVSAFLYGTIDEEAYVTQPLGFVDSKFPNKVYKAVKALYGLHQAPRAWYATLSTFLEKNGYRRGAIDKTLFIKQDKKDIMLVQVVWMILFLAQQRSLGVKQKEDGIFIIQDKYVAEILKKFDFLSVKTTSTLIETQKPLVKDEEAVDVDVYLYRYLKGQPKLGLWYPKVSSFDLKAYSDSDYAGANLDRKSTTRGYQFLGMRLISWQYKKQTIVATSTTKAEYVAAAHYYGQNPVFHSKTKHIEIRHHFVRDAYEKKLIQVMKIHTDDNVADLLTKAFDVSSKELVSPKKTALDDVDGMECLPNEEIFTELARMGYEKPPPKLTFYKDFLFAQWKFLIHTLVQCISAKRTVWNKFSCLMASAVICLTTVIINAQVDDLSSHSNQYTSLALTQNVFSNMRKVGKGFSRVETPLFATMLVQPQPPTAEEEDEEEEVVLEKDKIDKALEIFKLKRRVKKLEKKRKSKSLGLQMLTKVGGRIKTIDSNEEIALVDMDTQADLGAKLQGRKDDDNATIKDDSIVEPTVFDDEELKPGRKMEHFKGMTYDKVKPIFEREYNKVQTLFKPDKDKEPTKKRVVEKTLLRESFKKLKAVKVSSSRSTLDTPTGDLKEISEEDVKNMLEIILVSEFKVEALQVKVGGITQAYQSFEDMLKDFDREDMDALWRLVKEKSSSAVPTVDKEKALWVELKRLFEPDANDVIWKLQRYMHYLIIWKLYSSYGVHQKTVKCNDEDLHEGQSTKEKKFGYILQVIKKLDLKKLDGLLAKVDYVQRLKEKALMD